MIPENSFPENLKRLIYIEGAFSRKNMDKKNEKK